MKTTDEYNPNQFTFQQAKGDGIYMGRMLMKSEVLRILKTQKQTKALAKALDLIERIEVDPYAADSVR